MPEKTIVAKAFVINKDGLILTLKRSSSDHDRPMTWDLAGGTVEYGEDPTDTVSREILEESGLMIENPQVFITKTTNNDKYIVRLLYYVRTSEDAIKLSSEHDAYKWVTPYDFSELDIPEYYKDCVGHLPAKFL